MDRDRNGNVIEQMGLIAVVLKSGVLAVGNVLGLPQIVTFTPSNVGVGDTFTATIDGADNNYVAVGGDTVLDIVENLDAEIESNHPYLVVTENDVVLTVTGSSFTASSSTIDGNASDNQTLTADTIQSPEGVPSSVTGTVSKVHVQLGVAPAGSDMLIEVTNVSKGTKQTFTIPGDAKFAVLDASLRVDSNDQVSARIIQVGSGTPGSDLAMTVFAEPVSN
jgi:hypothetical protein